MNATAALTAPDHGLSPAVLAGEAILRALAARAEPFSAYSNLTELAQVTGRPAKNMGRDVSQLEAAGLVRPDRAALDADALTDAGRAAVGALDRAAGQGTAGPAAQLFVPPALLDDNPLNPRKAYDADKLEGLADTIEADGRVIEPLNVSPVQPDGRRFIWAGHRRKRAALIVEARFAARGQDLPAGLAHGVPCVEREATAAESLFIAVVENAQRENLTPWEDARALAALAEATGWSGRELARKTGRAPRLDDGDEEGVRDVQEKIKVARTAPADLVEAHESGAITWEQLRGALRTGGMPTLPSDPAEAAAPDEVADEPAPHSAAGDPPLIPDEAPALELTPRQRLILLEIAHAARFHPDAMPQNAETADGGSGFAATGKYWLDMDANGLQSLRLIDFKHHGRPYVRLTPKGVEWMVENIDAELGAALTQARNDVGQVVQTGQYYVTEWLNPPPLSDDARPTLEPSGPQEALTDDQADRERAAATLLAETAVAVVQADPPADVLAALLIHTGATGPFSAPLSDPGLVVGDDGECVCVADVDGRLPDDMARARALIIASALNRATGAELERA